MPSARTPHRTWPVSVWQRQDWSWSPAEGALAASAGSREAYAQAGQTTVDRVVDRVAVCRPDVRAAGADLQAAVAEAKLALASRMPNLDIGPAYERDEDKTVFWGVAAQMAVPVFGQGVDPQAC